MKWLSTTGTATFEIGCLPCQCSIQLQIAGYGWGRALLMATPGLTSAKMVSTSRLMLTVQPSLPSSTRFLKRMTWTTGLDARGIALPLITFP